MINCFKDRRSLKQIGGFRAYLRQVWASLRFWLRGPA